MSDEYNRVVHWRSRRRLIRTKLLSRSRFPLVLKSVTLAATRSSQIAKQGCCT